MKLTSPRTVMVLGVLLLVAVGLAAWFVVLGPRLAVASGLSAQASDMELANAQLRNRYTQTMDQVAAAPEAAAEAQALFASMPQAAELPDVLRQIGDAAREAGIGPDAVRIITTSVPEPVGRRGANTASGVNLATMGVSLTIDGSRPALLSFIDNLQGLDRALLINESQFTGSAELEADATETLTLAGTMFVLESSLPDLVADMQALMAEVEASAEASAPPAEPAG